MRPVVQHLCAGTVCGEEGFEVKLRQRDVDRGRERRERRDEAELALVGSQPQRDSEADVLGVWQCRRQLALELGRERVEPRVGTD
jgi:hypothetical protein